MADIKEISGRLSYKKHPDGAFTMVISPKIQGWEMYLLTFWVFSWTFAGLFVFTQLFAGYDKDTTLFMICFMVFWLYFEYRIGYVWMWRRKGFELIKIEDGKLSYKRSVKKYGKVYDFYLDNIEKFGKEVMKISYANVLSNSFWVIGGERLRFDYQGKEIKIGVQLDEKESDEAVKVIRHAMIEEINRYKQYQETLKAEAEKAKAEMQQKKD